MKKVRTQGKQGRRGLGDKEERRRGSGNERDEGHEIREKGHGRREP
jgi:hypothetical protein